MTKKDFIERYGEDAWGKVLENKKKYYQDNKEHINKRNNQYYKNNKEQIIEQHKQHYQDNKENIIAQHKQYLNTPMGKAARIINHCKERDNALFGENKCDLTHDWIINNIIKATHCHYCGCELNYDNLSIDRKNSELPHTKDNCVACCKTCNNCKQDTPYEEYIAKLRETSNN